MNVPLFFFVPCLNEEKLSRGQKMKVGGTGRGGGRGRGCKKSSHLRGDGEFDGLFSVFFLTH